MHLHLEPLTGRILAVFLVTTVRENPQTPHVFLSKEEKPTSTQLTQGLINVTQHAKDSKRWLDG